MTTPARAGWLVTLGLMVGLLYAFEEQP